MVTRQRGWKGRGSGAGGVADEWGGMAEGPTVPGAEGMEGAREETNIEPSASSKKPSGGG